MGVERGQSGERGEIGGRGDGERREEKRRRGERGRTGSQGQGYRVRGVKLTGTHASALCVGQSPHIESLDTQMGSLTSIYIR